MAKHETLTSLPAVAVTADGLDLNVRVWHSQETPEAPFTFDGVSFTDARSGAMVNVPAWLWDVVVASVAAKRDQ